MERENLSHEERQQQRLVEDLKEMMQAEVIVDQDRHHNTFGVIS
jgi:hypothetical protein